MDLLCPQCGEPWDIDELHETGLSYEEARLKFRSMGCEVFDSDHNEQIDAEGASLSGALMDILGDDMDAVAAELEDFGL